MEQTLYDNHLKILQEELLVALGCTEPIAIAYAGAKARQLLGEKPRRCVVKDVYKRQVRTVRLRQ